jgi:hypothetical protein
MKTLSQRLYDAAIQYEGTNIRGLLCRAGDALLEMESRTYRLDDLLNRGTVSTNGLYGDMQILCRQLEDELRSTVERCARICEQSDEDGEGPDTWGWHAKDFAAAIRELNR